MARKFMHRLPTIRVRFMCVALLSKVVLCGALSAAEEPVNMGNRRQLLLDDRFVEHPRNVQFVVHPPRKTGDIIFNSEPGQALGGYHSVLHHAGQYHLWYTAGGAILYARSADGVHWEKPALNLVKSDAETAIQIPSNLVVGQGAGDVKGGTHGLMVFLDPNAPRDQELRMVINPEEYASKIQLLSSPDGIHWKLTHRDLIVWRGEKPQLDSQNVIFWDGHRQKYVAYVRLKLRRQGSPMRAVVRAESARLGDFPPVEDWPVVMRSDDLHPGHLGPRGQATISVLDTYTNGTLKYPWADDAYLMFPTDYYHYGSWNGEFREEFPINAGALDARFAASRDGVKWNRFDNRPFIGLGMKGEFDRARVYPVYGVVPAPNGRELYLYYLGTSETHGWNRDDRNNRLLTAAGLAPTGPSALSRVVLRRDGFVSVRAPATGGEFTTPALVFAGEQLLLNVDTSASGELRVEILDEQGGRVPGFTLDDCDIIHTANEIGRVVAWKGQSELKPLAGKPIRLRFVMRDVDLYAFQFAHRGGI